MIEVTLEFRLDAFLVNSVGGTGELAGKMPTQALRFICENISSARKLTEHAPSADFEFLGGSSHAATKAEAAKGFDDLLFQYLTTHTAVDVSCVTIASEASGYSTMPKGVATGEIGRISLAKLADQSRVDIELVLKNEEFNAIWALTAEHGIRQAIATLVCFELKLGNPPPNTDTNIVAGIVSSSLQMVPRNGS